jgi:hypothetical protein
MKTYKLIKVVGIISVSLFLIDLCYPFLPKIFRYVTGVLVLISVILDYYFMYFKHLTNGSKKL